MAIKIPTYERHVSLDAGAQTMPRIPANDQVGKALTQTGNAIMSVAEHWKKRQEQFENFQMAQRETLALARVKQIIDEETLNYDPSRDRPGTLHERIMARVPGVLQPLVDEAPARLKPWYQERHAVATEKTSIGVAAHESQIGVSHYTSLLDKAAGSYIASLKDNPDGFADARSRMEHDVEGAVNIPASQRKIMLDAYTKKMGESVIQGYTKVGRHDEAIKFADDLRTFMDERSPPQQQEPAQKTGPQSGLNQNRINQINAKPEIAAAIERAAAAHGVDPNLAKVVASIESGGNPRAGTGSYKGLFQLNTSGFGMHGGGDIFNADDNAMAGVSSLKADMRAFKKNTGRDPTPGEIYMSHQQGQGGVLQHSANPDQPAWVSMFNTAEGQRKGETWARQAIWGNIPSDLKAKFGNVENVTSGDLMAIYDSKIRGIPVSQAIAEGRSNRAVAASAPQPPNVQVADASGHIIGGVRVDAPTPGAPAPAAAPATPTAERPQLTPWGSWADSQKALIDGSRLKMESKDISMKAKLKSVMDSDIASITATGKPVQLDRELKEYFKTETLSHELISSKLGEGAALTWEDNRQLAQRVNGATEGMEGLPQSAIMDRLNRLVPQGGEPDFIRRQAVSEAASKQATKIINDRLADPAAAADKQPEVAALLEKIHADPTDMQAAKDLTVARMKAQEYLGIPDRMRTPITLNEARQIANPLLDKANANPALAAKTIVDSVKAITGGDADLAHRALSTVLQVKDVSKEQAESTASALAAANRPVAQGDAPAQPKKLTGFDPTQPYTGSDGIPSYYPPPPGPSDNYADNPDVGNPFVPGAKMLPAEHIKMLRQNPGLSSEFDTTHGRGAAQWVFDNQPQANSTQGFDESGMAGAGADPYASPDTPDNGFE